MPHSVLFIAAYDVESPQSYLIEIPKERAVAILERFSNNFESLASHIKIYPDRMVLISPVTLLSITM